MIAGRSRSPYIFANLHAEIHAVTRAEEYGVSRKADALSGKQQVGVIQILSGSKPALLIEFTIVRQVGLGDKSQEVALLNDGSTIEQQVTTNHGQSYDDNDIERAGEFQQFQYGLLSLIQQQLLAKKILTGVSRDAQLRKDNDFHALAFSLGNQTFQLFLVIVAIGHLHRRYGCCHRDKSVFHISFDF